MEIISLNLLVPESWVQKSWHLILQSRGGFASVLVPASVAIALLANGFHDEFVVFIIRGVVGVVDRRYVDFLLLVGDDGFGTNFGVGSGVHYLMDESQTFTIPDFKCGSNGMISRISRIYVAPVTLQSAWQLAETFD